MKKIIFGLLLLMTFSCSVTYADTSERQTTNDVSFYDSETGSLTILDIPMIQFGDHVLLDENQTFKSVGNQNIKVRDDRVNKSSWRLQVTQVDNFSNGENILKNAVIKFNNKNLIVGEPFDIWTSNFSNKQIIEIPTNKFSLFMPAKATDVEGKYAAKVNWRLSDGVENE